MTKWTTNQVGNLARVALLVEGKDRISPDALVPELAPLPSTLTSHQIYFKFYSFPCLMVIEYFLWHININDLYVQRPHFLGEEKYLAVLEILIAAQAIKVGCLTLFYCPEPRVRHLTSLNRTFSSVKQTSCHAVTEWHTVGASTLQTEKPHVRQGMSGWSVCPRPKHKLLSLFNTSLFLCSFIQK